VQPEGPSGLLAFNIDPEVMPCRFVVGQLDEDALVESGPLHLGMPALQPQGHSKLLTAYISVTNSNPNDVDMMGYLDALEVLCYELLHFPYHFCILIIPSANQLLLSPANFTHDTPHPPWYALC
jgi:hypothetical protein